MCRRQPHSREPVGPGPAGEPRGEGPWSRRDGVRVRSIDRDCCAATPGRRVVIATSTGQKRASGCGTGPAETGRPAKRRDPSRRAVPVHCWPGWRRLPPTWIGGRPRPSQGEPVRSCHGCQDRLGEQLLTAPFLAEQWCRGGTLLANVPPTAAVAGPHCMVCLPPEPEKQFHTGHSNSAQQPPGPRCRLPQLTDPSAHCSVVRVGVGLHGQN